MEDPISPTARADPLIPIPEINIVRALDVWCHVETPIQLIVAKYLDTWPMLCPIRVAMKETNPSSAPEGRTQ